MEEQQKSLNKYAESYVRLALALGVHEDGYIDAYYGEQALRRDAEQSGLTLLEIIEQADEVAEGIVSIKLDLNNESLLLRQEFLHKQVLSVAARAKMNNGIEWSFDEESRQLYDTQAPSYDETYFQSLLDQLRQYFPQDKPLVEQYLEFQKQFVIPKDRLDNVFQAAISEARKRSKQYAPLQENEAFVLEYVNNKVWSGYNWYQGNNRSLIQINTDLPIYIDRAIDLAAHEGYPGHHVYNALLENKLYRENGWLEFSVYPLYSPQSVIAEGTANYGIELAFPFVERIEFEQDVLFPLAGIDPSLTERYYQVHSLMHRLNYANNEVGRKYFSGEIDKAEAVRWLQQYLLYEPERAEQRLRFLQTNRSYVINYNWGQDLVKAYIDHHMQNSQDHKLRWRIFIELLSSPRLPSGLRVPHS